MPAPMALPWGRLQVLSALRDKMPEGRLVVREKCPVLGSMAPLSRGDSTVAEG